MPRMEDARKGTKEERLDRRRFLIGGASLLLGGFFGLEFASRVQACPRESSPEFGNDLRPCAAVIIDDIGNSVSRAREFLDLRMPLTFSILPQLPHSCSIAEELCGKGQRIMLHQPMEPYRDDIDPGPGALYVSDRPIQIERTIRRNLYELPPVVGVNNHMGSRFTASPRKVDQALRVIKERDLFFVDSLTSSRSIAYETATRLRMRTAFRNTFIDFLPEEREIMKQLKRLERHAALYGVGIGIGHPYSVTLKALARYAWERSEWRPQVNLVHASDLLCPGRGPTAARSGSKTSHDFQLRKDHSRKH